MKNQKTIKKILNLRSSIFALVLLGAFCLPQGVLALGISPALLQLDSVAAGEKAEGKFIVSRAEPGVENQVKVVVGEYAEYVELPDNGVLDLPAGERQVDLPIIVDTDGLEPGNYKTNVVITLLADEDAVNEGSGSDILSGLKVELEFTVTEATTSLNMGLIVAVVIAIPLLVGVGWFLLRKQ